MSDTKQAQATTTVTSCVATNGLVDSFLTDLYQITMAYAYWHSGRQNEHSVFDLFFRKNPFHGEFTIFAGLDESLKYVSEFKFTTVQIDWLKSKFPAWKPGFWEYLATVDTSKVQIYAVEQGTIVFPRTPLMRLEGPLAVCQLLETTLLNLINFPSLMATNAARHRLAAGPDKKLLEFGLRRAQGPDGAVSASKYSYIGGFDGSSSVKAAHLFDMEMKGTHAHAFVISYTGLDDVKERTIESADGKQTVDFVDLCMKKRKELNATNTNEGELAAFIAYAQSYPSGFLALIDSYDTLTSGLMNFLAVALVLHDLGYTVLGVRLDSGDLAYLSKQCRRKFIEISEKYNAPFEKLNIVASNDLSVGVILSLNDQKHSIDTFGIGTHLVTCKEQPALGCVYKLVEIDGKPRIKISQDIVKVTLPGRKTLYRLFDKSDTPMFDLLVLEGSQVPEPGKRILCRHPFDASKRAFVTPSRVDKLHRLVWDGKLTKPLDSLEQCRDRVKHQMRVMRADHLRNVNPTPYKVSLSEELYDFMHDLWLSETPIPEIE
jgi:nicotinate phosphoribosyltransferase